MVYTDNLRDLLNVVDRLCSRFNVLCGEQDEAVLKFALTWIENFLYIDPIECVADIACVEKIFDMHSSIVAYAYRGEYLINISEHMITVTEKLLKLNEIG
ncbi:MAG: hypothetical protein QXG46_05300 [Ignisphaera sp.]